MAVFSYLFRIFYHDWQIVQVYLTLAFQGMRTATLRVYDSEADSDYDLKPMELNQGHTSTENLADDEREDSSEAEPDPEPDYEDDLTSGRLQG